MDHSQVDYLVIGGKHFKCPRVVQWGQSKLEHVPGRAGCRERKTPADLVVVHWTGGERTTAQSYAFAQRLTYGYHIAIDRKGVVWQHCDPALVVTQHGGRPVNNRSVGVVLTGYGFTVRAEQPPLPGRDRLTYTAQLHKRTRLLADFYPEQYASLGWVVDALCDGLGVPRETPPGPAAAMSAAQLAGFHGVIGHYHVTTSKSDPGPAPLDWLHGRWAL